MKIAVVGCGALGSFYGAKLNRVEPDVFFLLRTDYAHVSAHGVRIESADGDFHIRPHCARDPTRIGRCDLVLIGLKTTAHDQLPRLLPPLTGPNTLVLTLQNGLGNEEALAAILAPHNILGGLCFVCVNRIASGYIRHTAYGRIVLGEYERKAGLRTHALADLFQQAGIACEITDDLARAHWEKLIWNVPFNGLGVGGAAGYPALISGELPPGAPLGPCLPTDQLLADEKWERLVRELMGEVIAAGRAHGHDIAESQADENLNRTRAMGAYRASTLLDFDKGLPLELESLFLEPLRRAQKAGVRAPRLAALCQVLTQLDQRRNQRPSERARWESRL